MDDEMLPGFIEKVKGIAMRHKTLNLYLQTQKFMTWAVGSCHNPTSKYKSVFRYNFDLCEFRRPIVIRNPNLQVDNAAQMLVTLADIRAKLNHTDVFSISEKKLLWLGSRRWITHTCVKCVEPNQHVWLKLQSNSDDVVLSSKGNHDIQMAPGDAGVVEHGAENERVHAVASARGEDICYNAMWFPEYHMYIQFKSAQTVSRCATDVLLRWADTTNCCDETRQTALVNRLKSSSHTRMMLYHRECVDWELFAPFDMHLLTTCAQTDDTSSGDEKAAQTVHGTATCDPTICNNGTNEHEETCEESKPCAEARSSGSTTRTAPTPPKRADADSNIRVCTVHTDGLFETLCPTRLSPGCYAKCMYNCNTPVSKKWRAPLDQIASFYKQGGW